MVLETAVVDSRFVTSALLPPPPSHCHPTTRFSARTSRASDRTIAAVLLAATSGRRHHDVRYCVGRTGTLDRCRNSSADESTGQTGRVDLVGRHRPGDSSLQPSDISGCCHRLRV
uniref:Uncharacterized protein n=1 Tax=Hyaloperonospora arabidopsidis (strain Emoy2) TaxID=559515 RepID=M4BCF4_HYAAE